MKISTTKNLGRTETDQLKSWLDYSKNENKKKEILQSITIDSVYLSFSSLLL